MIALTGAGGFIGSVLLGYLNKKGITNVVLFDDLPQEQQFKNLVGKQYISIHSTDEIFQDAAGITCVVHIGADSNTLTTSWSSLYKTNVLSTRKWNQFCLHNDIPFIFTSSAAIYGNGQGPLNQYALSKLVSENETQGVILRLFNVYGPNENHKGRMASTPFHWFNQLKTDGNIKVFKDSSQYYRDFVWVEDVARTIHYFIENYEEGIYDVGTGVSVDFDTVANNCIKSYGSGSIEYIEMPKDLRLQYQSNTRAGPDLPELGVDISTFIPIDKGIELYYEYLKRSEFY